MFRKILLLNISLFISVVACSKNKRAITPIENPASDNSSLPRLFTDNTETVFMSWVEQEGDSSTLYYSRLNNKEWIDKEVISGSSSWFVNWADFPSLISRNGAPQAAHWLQKIPGNTYSYNVEISTYLDNGFEEALVPHSDNTPTEHGFVSMASISDTSFYAIWLDGRKTSGGHGDHGDLNSAMTLRGALISNSGSILEEHELDSSVCDCCNTSIARTKNGLIAAYRDRTHDETRDIYVKKMVNGVWENAKPIFNDGWTIAACPVNGPSLSVFNNTVAAGWFTGADNSAIVKLSFSNDLGETFSTPFVIDSTSALGRVDVNLEDEKSAWISWISRSGESGLLNLKLVSSSGKILKSFTVSDINPSRGSGFPQITKSNDQLIIAWTELREQQKQIKTAILEL